MGQARKGSTRAQDVRIPPALLRMFLRTRPGQGCQFLPSVAPITPSPQYDPLAVTSCVRRRRHCSVRSASEQCSLGEEQARCRPERDRDNDGARHALKHSRIPLDAGKPLHRAAPTDDRNRMASSATVPIVVAIPAVRDSSTSATIGAVLCTQAKPRTEIVSGHGSRPTPAVRACALSDARRVGNSG